MADKSLQLIFLSALILVCADTHAETKPRVAPGSSTIAVAQAESSTEALCEGSTSILEEQAAPEMARTRVPRSEALNRIIFIWALLLGWR
jgi:hypothetical protein